MDLNLGPAPDTRREDPLRYHGGPPLEPDPRAGEGVTPLEGSRPWEVRQGWDNDDVEEVLH